MATRSALVGRDAERERLEDAVRRAASGAGGLVLVAGEAGVGKTRLAEEVAAGSGARILWGRASHGAAVPYAAIVDALRSHLRANPESLAGCGPLRPHLALLLPELGEPAPAGDRATLFEAVRCAFAHLARQEPVLVILDDLQWSDEATLELLPALAEPLSRLALLMVGVYRSDGLPRDHMLRRLRHELRRGGRLVEITLSPLDRDQTAALVEQILGAAPAPSLAAAIHDRTQGVPFFVEELARGLLLTDSLTTGRVGLELARSGEVPVPETIRDAVLIGVSELSPEARTAADAAAVCGQAFDLELCADVSSAAGLAELVERGLVTEAGSGHGAFRHALTREALYADLPWLQRRALHRRLAEALDAAGARSIEVATHWLGARDEERARQALLGATLPERRVRPSSSGPRARTRSAGWRRSRPTPTAPSCPARSPRRRGPGARSARCEPARGAMSSTPARSAGWPPFTT